MPPVVSGKLNKLRRFCDHKGVLKTAAGDVHTSAYRSPGHHQPLLFLKGCSARRGAANHELPLPDRSHCCPKCAALLHAARYHWLRCPHC